MYFFVSTGQIINVWILAAGADHKVFVYIDDDPVPVVPVVSKALVPTTLVQIPHSAKWLTISSGSVYFL